MTPEKKRGNPAAEMELQKELEDKVIGRMIDIYHSSPEFGKVYPIPNPFQVVRGKLCCLVLLE